MKRLLPLLAFGLALPCPAFDFDRDPLLAPSTNVLFRAGDDGYHTFRIPSLIVTTNGTLVAICEGRKTDAKDHGDIDLVSRRSTDAGTNWSPLRVLHEQGGTEPITIGNPCALLERQTDRIWLTFTRDNKDVLVTHSDDAGQTWAAPRDITADVKKPDWTWYATGPGAGIQITNGSHQGRIIIPCDHRESADGKPVKRSHVFYSDDHGATWKLGGSAPQHTDECQLAELPDGSLLLSMRQFLARDGGDPSAKGKRARAISHDGGETWQDFRLEEALPDPCCQASLIRFDGKDRLKRHLLLFTNPASPEKREALTLRLSYDGGKTWPVAKPLWAGPSAYSCLATLPSNNIGCLFECGDSNPNERIVFSRFSLHWLETIDSKALPPAGLSLFDGKSMGQWLKGDFRGQEATVRLDEGSIVMEKGNDMTGITWGGPVTRMNYEICLEARRLDGSDFFCGLTFPVGENPCTLVLGGWGGSLVGLSCIDYEDAANNETGMTMRFEDKRWYQVRVRVTRSAIEAWIDGEQVIDVETTNRRIGIRFEVEPSRPLGIATWRTTGAVRDIRIFPVTPTDE
ncbi:MAG TPA: exo-alpha-sialidase [Verrucomicrobiae bacterium]|nr:exo-alpha-sialidase [Verrucomicrobiae bacterium]